MKFKLITKIETIESLVHTAKNNNGFTENEYAILEQELEVLKRYVSINLKSN